MNQIFNPENFFWKCFDKMADTLGLSLLWLLCSLPVVTIGPACAALYDAAARCVRGGEPAPYRRFLRTFRRELKPAVLCWLVWGGALLLLFCGYRIAAALAADSGSRAMAVLSVAYLVLMALPAGVLCWLFPLLSRFTYTFPALNRAALQFWFAHLPSTLAMTALLALCAQVSVRLMFFPLCFLPCLLALAHSLFAERAFRRHLPNPPGPAPDGGVRPQ